MDKREDLTAFSERVRQNIEERAPAPEPAPQPSASGAGGRGRKRGFPGWAKWTLIVTGSLVVLLFAATVLFTALYPNVFYGVTLHGQPVGGMSKGELSAMLRKSDGEIGGLQLLVKAGDDQITTPFDDLIADYGTEAAQEAAMAVGRSGNLFSNSFQMVRAMLGGLDIDFQPTPDQEAIGRLSDQVEQLVHKDYEEPTYQVVDDDHLEVYAGVNGEDLDKDAFQKAVLEKLAKLDTTELVPQLSEHLVTLNVDTMYQELAVEPKDAYVEQGSDGGYQVMPHTVGVDFNKSDVIALTMGNGETYEVPATITVPELTYEKLRATAFVDTVASKSSKLNAGNVPRTTNVRLALEKINGTVVNPGEVFSFNKTVGERTEAKGFKPATIFANGEQVDGIGGGICQVTSTLYSALLRTEMEIVQRKPHRFTVTYVPMGEDATVAWGAIDFQFKNTTPYPIRIDASLNGSTVNIVVKGTLTGTEPEIKIVSTTLSSVQPITKTTVDPSLKPGETKVEQKGYAGYQVRSYKVYMENGKEVKRVDLGISDYKAAPNVIKVGPEAPEDPNTPAGPVEPVDPVTPTDPTDPTTDPTAPPETDPTTDPGTPSTENPPEPPPTDPATQPSEGGTGTPPQEENS